MPAYLIGQINVKDEQLWQEYVAGVADSLLPFNGKIVFRGRRAAVLAGENDRALTVVVKFADHDVLNSWFQSRKYQSLIPVRDKAADVVITSYKSY